MKSEEQTQDTLESVSNDSKDSKSACSDEDSVIKMILERAYSMRKVNRNYDDVSQLVSRICRTLFYFGSLKEFDLWVEEWHMRIEDIKVLSELSFLVQPAAVKFNPLDPRSKDVSIHPSVKIAHNDYNSYLNDLYTLRGLFKRDASSDVVSLSSIKVVKSLYDVMSIMSFNKRCHFEEQVKSWPIKGQKKVLDSLFESSYLNESEDFVQSDYIKHLSF